MAEETTTQTDTNQTTQTEAPQAPVSTNDAPPVEPIIDNKGTEGGENGSETDKGTDGAGEGDKPVKSILEGSEGDKPKEGEADEKKDSDAPKEGAETTDASKYEYKLPEGFELKGELRTEIDKFVSEGKLTQEQAQAGVDLFMKAQKANAEAYLQSNESFYRKETDALQKDAEYGGQNYQQTRALIGKGYEAFLNLIPEGRADLRAGLNEMMVKSRMANLLPFSVALRNLGAALKEGGSINAGNTAVGAQPVQFKTGQNFSIAEAVAANFPDGQK